MDGAETDRRQRFRRKYLLRLLSSPSSLGPVLAGITASTAAWAFGLSSVVTFGGLAALLGGLGIVLTRLAIPDPKKADAAAADVEHEIAREQQRALDDLERRLAADSDARDEQLLRDLRTIMSSFKDQSLWPENLAAHTTVDIVTGVDELFSTCVASLERGLSLAAMASKVATAEAREPILGERERIIDEVGNSLQQLTQILTRVQRLREPQGPETELGRIREELDESLRVAARVSARMRAWRNDAAELEDHQNGSL